MNAKRVLFHLDTAVGMLNIIRKQLRAGSEPDIFLWFVDWIINDLQTVINEERMNTKKGGEDDTAN